MRERRTQPFNPSWTTGPAYVSRYTVFTAGLQCAERCVSGSEESIHRRLLLSRHPKCGQRALLDRPGGRQRSLEQFRFGPLLGHPCACDPARSLQEIVQVARGPIRAIRGDQQEQAVFVFSRPDQPGIDREVTFGVFGGEWKSTG